MKPSVQSFKVGQVIDVYVSYVDDSKAFYVQQNSRLADLEHLETCIQNFARVLLADKDMLNEYCSFQEKSNKFDLVLVKSSWDNKWKRAIFLDRISSEYFDQYCSSDDEDHFELVKKEKTQKTISAFS